MFELKISDELSLRLWDIRMAEDYFKVVAKNISYFKKFIQWVHDDYTLDEAKQSVSNHISCYANGTRVYCAIQYQGKIIGLCGLHAINQNYKSAEIGFRVDKSYAGKGIMTKCVKTIIKIGFDMGLERISADTVCDNIAAQKVLIKSGFLFEGVLKKGYKIDGVLVDSQLYAIVK